MRSNKQFYTSKGSTQVGLYSFVFTRRISQFAIGFLFVSFLVQPFHLALANEAAQDAVAEPVLPDEITEQLPDAPEVVDEVAEPVTDETTVTEEDVAPTAEGESADSEATQDSSPSDEQSQPDEVDNQTATSSDGATETEDVVDEETDDTSTTTPETGTSSSTSTSTDDGQDDSNTGGGSGGQEEEARDTASSTDETGSTGSTTTPGDTATTTSTTTDDGSNNGSESDDASQDETQDDTTTDGEEEVNNDDEDSTIDDLVDSERIEDGVNDLVDEVVNEVVTLTRQLVTEENYYQFSRQSCVSVGGGTYHCSANTDAPLDPDSAVYAEQDEGGDMEIYLRTSKGEVKKLTDNDFDDTSPDVDLVSMRVVWQRLIDGRYQIISYDLEERVETQLTFSKDNRMEPKVAEEGIVWQAWDGNDWEIVFFDGQFTEQITSNDIQDVTPVIEDGFILWNVLGGKESEARVYTIETGEVVTITGYEGGTVANPRFVLVYDTKFDNGDIITQGFDPVTGLAQPLGAKPAELPFDIPEPDPVGEIRALINNKSSHDENEIIVVPTGDDDTDLNLASTTASSTDTLSLDNPNLDDGADIELPKPEEDFELEEDDLVITGNASSTNATINDEIEVPNLFDTATKTASTSTQL